MRLDVIFTMWVIYINFNLDSLTKLSTSNKSIKLKDTLPWNISQMIMKTVPIITRVVVSYGSSPFGSDRKLMETETKT